MDEQTFLVQAQTDIEEVNELINVNLPITEDYQTLGGFLIYQMQKIPGEGERLNYDGLELTVVAAEGPRLQEIRVRRLEPLPFLDGSAEIVDAGSNNVSESARSTPGAVETLSDSSS